MKHDNGDSDSGPDFDTRDREGLEPPDLDNGDSGAADPDPLAEDYPGQRISGPADVDGAAEHAIDAAIAEADNAAVLLDAARQLETAARIIRRLAGEGRPVSRRAPYLASVYANIDAALARLPERR